MVQAKRLAPALTPRLAEDTDMKKMMINSALALAAALGNSFGGLLDVVPPTKTRNRGKGRGRRLGQWNLNLKTSRPTDKRHWHNPNDQVQRDALQAAEAKRQRKAEKLYRDIKCSMRWNGAHHSGVIEQLGNVTFLDTPKRLNPLYVNRGLEA